MEKRLVEIPQWNDFVAQQKASNNSEKEIKTLFKFKKKSLVTVKDVKDFFAGKISPEMVEEYWQKKTGIDIKSLRSKSVDSTIITRPQAIDICEDCEALTGKKILMDSNTPMQYLETVTFGDVIDFFIKGSPAIDLLRKKIRNGNTCYRQELLELFKNNALKVYALNLGIVKPTEKQLQKLLNQKVKKSVNSQFVAEKDWQLPIFWTEEHLNVHLSGNLDWITDETKVSELIQAFVQAKEASLA